MKKIAYLGPESSYSHLAAQRIAGGDDSLVAMPSFSDVFFAVRERRADMAVLPIENSAEGNVNEVADGLIFDDAKTPLFINAEFVLKIENYLIAQKTAELRRIERIVTHWQPYAQCRRALKKLLPDAAIIFSDSTSAAVAGLSDDRTAAIGGIQSVKENLQVLGTTVNDMAGNCTRFVVLSSADTVTTASDKLTVVFEAENRPGGLLKLLEIFNVFGVNMTRIESRPHKSVLGRYVFIADLSGNVLDNNTSSALELIKRSTVYFKYLGCYTASC